MSVVELSIPSKKNYVFKNWAGIYSAKPKLFFQPRSIQEVVDIVKAANKCGKTIVTIGAGYSPSSMCVTNEWLVNLDLMNKIHTLSEAPNGSYADITVDAGIRICHLNEYLNEKGFTMQSLGSVAQQSIAGIISTGTHGSSPYHGLVSSTCVSLTIVNGKGEIVYLDSENNPEIFRAALLSLGKIGIIVAATVRAVPAFNIRATEEIITFEGLVEKWDSLWLSSEFIRVWWYPYSRKCVLWRGSKTQDPETAKPKSFLQNRFIRFLYEASLWISCKIYKPLTPYLEKFIFNKQFGQLESNPKSSVSRSPEGFALDCLFSQFTDEWACPLENGPEVLRSLDDSIARAAKNKEFFVHVPMEIRCANTTVPKEPLDTSQRTSTSEGPVYGNTLRPYLDNTARHDDYASPKDVTNNLLTVYIGTVAYRPFHCNTSIYKWFSVFEDTMTGAGGKPHWAKNFLGSTSLVSQDVKKSNYKDFEMRGMSTRIKEMYGDDLIEFQKIRKEQDPNNIFVMNKEWAVINGIVDINEVS
ncbi:D-arabinono-1,4-lactone oxidase NDAI_0K00250 [Naumovozyma dairenensis CBS 421]|uniref:D-arabinono-1,4-lactone oxidase n=1 Tax=Naumovozyma dairenensis (strain ATCC 10597 / BCRC 20456 / CBS 421 / NBRC 0211 / NRRL Y-12639) TaxID=1071378 RepID=G0WHF3_NAUDC|nr:hypothetical protein NDAI_0K00250 [Naumovozyma dairenensis CBS 421]CCD27214.1 hypothetical protein NDAI_0K00250 [Naumovozyma dairenensis CBS 421]